MEKLSQTVAAKISKLQKRFESYLENDFENKIAEAEALRQSFEASQDPALIRGLSIGLPEDHIDRTITVFSRLAHLFEIGVLLQNNDGNWAPQAFFYKGISEVFKAKSKIEITIPTVNLMTILTTPAQPLLKKLELTHLDPDNKNSCLLIKTSPDFAFILFSKLPDLWLKDHAEKIRRALFNGLAES